MKLSEIFTQLSFGELSQISLGGEQPGVVSAGNYEQLFAHVNLGLLALYKRFPLKESSLTLQLIDGKITYPLLSAFAVNKAGSTEPVRYIIDTATEKFGDDIFKIERVYTDTGYEMALNDRDDPYAVSTPSSTMLQVPWTIVAKDLSLPDYLKTSTLEVQYRASHPVITFDITTFDPATIEIELPYSHLEPLLLFVASRVNNPIGFSNAANGTNMGNNYAAKYEAACQSLEIMNLRVDQGSQSNRMVSNGWV